MLEISVAAGGPVRAGGDQAGIGDGHAKIGGRVGGRRQGSEEILSRVSRSIKPRRVLGVEAGGELAGQGIQLREQLRDDLIADLHRAAQLSALNLAGDVLALGAVNMLQHAVVRVRLQRETLVGHHQRNAVCRGQGQPMFGLRDGNIDQARELANQFVALILYGAGIFSQALHLCDLAVERRNLAGQPVDLVDGLRHCLVQARSDCVQACHRLMK